MSKQEFGLCLLTLRIIDIFIRFQVPVSINKAKHKICPKFGIDLVNSVTDNCIHLYWISCIDRVTTVRSPSLIGNCCQLSSALTEPLYGDDATVGIARGQRHIEGRAGKFWWLHGHISAGCVLLDAFLSQSGPDSETRAKMLAPAAALNRLRKNLELSRMYAEEAADIAQETGDHRSGALSLHQLGFLALDDNDFDAAGRLFANGLSLAEKLGDKQVVALLYNGMGELSRLKCDLNGAAECYSRSLQFNIDAGDRVRQTTSLINLGATAVLQNDIAAAGDFYRRGLRIASEMADMNGTLYSLEGLAGTYWAERDPKTAARLYGAAEALRTTNNLQLEAADQLPYERSVSRVRDAHAGGSFEDHFADGRSINLNDAIAIALSDTTQANR